MATGESSEHRAIVKALVTYLNQQGFQTIGAACEGFKQCAPIEERTPDFTGKNAQGLWCIGEAKTCDDLVNDRERTNEQLKTFAHQQMTSGNCAGQSVPFYIAIPKTCIEQLKQILKEIGLSAKSNITTLEYG